MLGAELGCPPREVTLSSDEAGKPPVPGSTLRFSAARSGGIARRFFTAAEREALAALAPERRQDAVFGCWTRKEALVKGIGAGLSFPTSTVDGWPGHGGKATVGKWSIHQVDVAPGFAAVNGVVALAADLGLGPADTVLVLPSAVFASPVTDLWLALAAGAGVVIARPGPPPMVHSLARLMTTERVSFHAAAAERLAGVDRHRSAGRPGAARPRLSEPP